MYNINDQVRVINTAHICRIIEVKGAKYKVYPPSSFTCKCNLYDSDKLVEHRTVEKLIKCGWLERNYKRYVKGLPEYRYKTIIEKPPKNHDYGIYVVLVIATILLAAPLFFLPDEVDKPWLSYFLLLPNTTGMYGY